MNETRRITLSNGKRSKTMEYVCGEDSQFVIKEVLIDEVYNFDFKPTDIVLNLGGHIGSFDVFAYDKVAKIHTFEPSDNFYKIQEHLILNKIMNVAPYKMAVSDHTGKTKFYLGPSGGHNSLMPVGEEIEVDCISLEDVFKLDAFTKMKVDIEGSEYLIFKDIKIPDTINEVWFETHTFNDELYQKHLQLVNYMFEQGFNNHVIPNDPQNRTFLLHSIR